MKQKFSSVLDETIKAWSKIANEVFPPRIHCRFCMQALAEYDGSCRFCPQCKFPLF